MECQVRALQTNDRGTAEKQTIAEFYCGTAEKQTIAGKFFNFALASRHRFRYLAETGVNVKVIHRELQRRKTLYVQMSNKRGMQSIIAMRNDRQTSDGGVNTTRKTRENKSALASPLFVKAISRTGERIIKLEAGSIGRCGLAEYSEYLWSKSDARKPRVILPRVKACGNGPLAMRICNVVSAERSAAKQTRAQHEEARFGPREEDSRAAYPVSKQYKIDTLRHAKLLIQVVNFDRNNKPSKSRLCKHDYRLSRRMRRQRNADATCKGFLIDRISMKCKRTDQKRKLLAKRKETERSLWTCLSSADFYELFEKFSRDASERSDNHMIQDIPFSVFPNDFRQYAKMHYLSLQI
ncbi:hypothetical protein EAG_01089 [Camponotus floridanus]|uniref:Uncharacterized protein n=1 Tax=Camponotus floridanus TaxID=104421 RepID=E2AB73_CAMFO|nr:hypothetical protein EAG_01089 [Camponotus floridanus]